MTTAREVVRLLIADTAAEADRRVLSDEQLATFLALNGVADPASQDAATWSVRRAAAAALETIAVSEVLVGKVIRTQDLATDGAKVSAELRALARTLREQADAEEEAALEEALGDGGGVVEVVEFHPFRGSVTRCP